MTIRNSRSRRDFLKAAIAAVPAAAAALPALAADKADKPAKADKAAKREAVEAGTAAETGTAAKGETASASPAPAPAAGREMKADVLIIGGSLGGIAAALAAARMGRTVLVTEETAWIGGQATTQGVPPDEHPWIEQYGRTKSYAAFREGIRAYYRRNYPLIPKARTDPFLNPGAGWVSALCFEPRVGIAVLNEMLAPHLAAGRIVILTRHRPVAVEMASDRARAVTVLDEVAGVQRTLTAPYILDATELGELLELGDVERVVGAESQAQTGEFNALEGDANPRDQMGFTHVMAFDYLPGEDHTIDKPRGYDRWNAPGKDDKPRMHVPDLFGVKRAHFGQKPDPERYVPSTWSFRRILCRGNFEEGAFPSDVTVPIWGGNECRSSVLCGVSPEERRRAMEVGRQLTLNLFYWLQTEAPDPATGRKGFPGLRPRGDVFGTQDGLAQYPYIRESTRIKAEFTVLEQHFRNDTPATKDGPVKYPDSVGVGGYRIDIHKPARKGGSGSMTGANHGKHWCQQIPLGALLPVRVENLLPACKNLGVTAVTNGAFRLHPVEWNIGEAAGALAAFCLIRNVVPRQVRATPALLADFQKELTRQGVELDWPVMATGRSYYSHHDVELKDAADFYFGEAWRLK